LSLPDLKGLASKLPEPEARPKINWTMINEKSAEYERERWKGNINQVNSLS